MCLQFENAELLVFDLTKDCINHECTFDFIVFIEFKWQTEPKNYLKTHSSLSYEWLFKGYDIPSPSIPHSFGLNESSLRWHQT